MEQQPLIEKVITISGFEQPSQTQYKIKDEHGLTYSFWSTKQDGNQTKAYQDWHTMQLGVGKVVAVAYVESPNPQNAQHPYRNIRAFAPANDIKYVQNDGRPQYTGQSPKQFTTPQATNPAPQTNQKPDWDEIAKGKVRHAFLLEAYKQNKHLDSELLTIIDGWVEAVMTGEMPEVSYNNLPPVGEVPNGEQEITVDDLPF